jgi:hypothetical protein
MARLEETEKQNITFRLDAKTLDLLRFEAEEKGSSVNSVAQAIFSTHYGWTANASKAGMMPIHKDILAMLIDKTKEDDIASIANLFAEVRVKDTALILRNDYSLYSFLDVLETWMKLSGVAFIKQMNSKDYSYTLSHTLGEKWSMFLSLILRKVFSKMGLSEVTFDVTDGLVFFTIPKALLRAK